MTVEQLKEFGEGKAFIDMEGTTEDNWIELINQCNKVGIDLDERARQYYSGSYSLDFDSDGPFVHYQREWNDKYGYLICTSTAITSWGNNCLELKLYKYEPGNLPLFEI